jgi:hypothetical protein
MARSDGFWAEALVTAVSQSTADAEEGLRAFLAKRPPEFRGAYDLCVKALLRSVHLGDCPACRYAGRRWVTLGT